MSDRTRVGPVAVLVPVKAFAQAKVRLAPALAPDARAALARAMAEHVLAACAPLPTAVVCDDADVADWARAHGARVVWEPGRGLNRAVQEGVAQLHDAGARRVIVAQHHVGLQTADPAHQLASLVDARLQLTVRVAEEDDVVA